MTYKKTIMETIAKIKSKISQSVFIALAMIVVGLGIAFGIFTTQATAGPGTPFGGQSYFVFTCNCSGNYAIYFTDLTISPAITLPLIYQPGGTILYPYYAVLTPGSWLLGTWNPGGSCTYFVGKGCATLPTQGTMYMVGTSM